MVGLLFKNNKESQNNNYMPEGILDIKNVPPSEGTGIMPMLLFNPTNQDFNVVWDGKVQGIIPAGKSLSLPEFLARHGAKHLAELIVSKKWKIKVNEAAVGQITPDTAKAVPTIEIQKMMEALLKGSEEAFIAMETPIGVPILIPVNPEIKPEPLPEKSSEELVLEKKALTRAKRQASATKARLVMMANREIRKQQKSQLT